MGCCGSGTIENKKPKIQNDIITSKMNPKIITIATNTDFRENNTERAKENIYIKDEENMVLNLRNSDINKLKISSTMKNNYNNDKADLNNLIKSQIIQNNKENHPFDNELNSDKASIKSEKIENFMSIDKDDLVNIISYDDNEREQKVKSKVKYIANNKELNEISTNKSTENRLAKHLKEYRNSCLKDENQNVNNLQQQNININQPFLQSNVDSNFNMKELDYYKGSGLKKMKAYISNLEQMDLIKKREDFWSSRFEGNKEIWDTLKYLIESDLSELEIKEILYASEIKTHSGCLNLVYDSRGVLYEIPNYVIHLPDKYCIPKLNVAVPNEQIITLKVRYLVNEKSFKVSNLLSVFDFLKKVAGKFETNVWNIRLFFRGKELKDEDLLYMYDLEEESIILMSIKN